MTLRPKNTGESTMGWLFIGIGLMLVGIGGFLGYYGQTLLNSTTISTQQSKGDSSAQHPIVQTTNIIVGQFTLPVSTIISQITDTRGHMATVGISILAREAT